MIKVDKTNVEYEGTAAELLAEVSMVLRDFAHKEGILTEDDFDFMKKMVFKPQKELEKDAWKRFSNNLAELVEFLEKLSDDKADD